MSFVIVGYHRRTTLRPKPPWPKTLIGSLPLLWRSEFRNIVTLAIRKRTLTIEAAQDIMRTAEASLDGSEFAVSSEAVLKLTARSSCTAYDCEFVALAQAEGVRLVTADRQILQEFPEVAVSLQKFVRD